MRFLVETPQQVDKVTAACRKALDGGAQEVTIRKWHRDKSWEQLKLWHKWMKELERDSGTGMTEEEWDWFFRENVIFPIYVADNINNYEEQYRNLLILYRERHPIYNSVRDNMIAGASKKNLSVKQMMVALNKVKHHATMNVRCQLTMPELRGLI